MIEEILSFQGLKLLILSGSSSKITLIPSDFNLLDIFISFLFELFSNTKTFFPSDLSSFAALIPELPVQVRDVFDLIVFVLTIEFRF